MAKQKNKTKDTDAQIAQLVSKLDSNDKRLAEAGTARTGSKLKKSYDKLKAKVEDRETRTHKLTVDFGGGAVADVYKRQTLQQRNGRAVRQGNTQAVIGIKYIMSARSLDVIRFNMIVGKLGWMTDLLSSADRETNNPAAQSEMSADEMVMYMSRDPESAKRAIEVLRATQAEAAAGRIKTRAWNELRGLISSCLLYTSRCV